MGLKKILGHLVGWRSLENHQYDLCLVMFYKIQYGLIAMPMPSNFKRPIGITRVHPLSFCQVYPPGTCYC